MVLPVGGYITIQPDGNIGYTGLDGEEYRNVFVWRQMESDDESVRPSQEGAADGPPSSGPPLR